MLFKSFKSLIPDDVVHDRKRVHKAVLAPARGVDGNADIPKGSSRERVEDSGPASLVICVTARVRPHKVSDPSRTMTVPRIVIGYVRRKLPGD